MSRLHLAFPHSGLVANLVSDIRQRDCEEWVAASGMRVEKGLQACIKRAYEDERGSARAVVAEDGACLAIWGVAASGLPGEGVAWMVCTNRAAHSLHSMHRLFEAGIAEMHQAYPRLVAWAWDQNTLHHRWMLRMGFEHSGDWASFAHLGFRFLKFTRGPHVL